MQNNAVGCELFNVQLWFKKVEALGSIFMISHLGSEYTSYRILSKCFLHILLPEYYTNK